MTEFKNAPYLKVASPTLSARFDKSIFPKKIPINGLIKLVVSDVTIAVKAPPIMTPTAKSMTLDLSQVFRHDYVEFLTD